MATRQPHDAPPGSDADQPREGSAAPSPEDRPTDLMPPGAARPLPPGEEPTVELHANGAPAQGGWVAARPDPEAREDAPPEPPATGWGTGTPPAASPWSRDPSQPPPARPPPGPGRPPGGRGGGAPPRSGGGTRGAARAAPLPAGEEPVAA